MTLHLRNQHGNPIGSDEFESLDEVSAAVIDGTFERRWVISIDNDGTVSCDTCDGACEHEERVEQLLTEKGLA